MNKAHRGLFVYDLEGKPYKVATLCGLKIPFDQVLGYEQEACKNCLKIVKKIRRHKK